MYYKDYYNILGVEKTAGVKEIKKAYRKLAKRYHPDANQDDKKAEERFKEISEAHEVLSDPEKRQKYDAIGADVGADWQNFDWSSYGNSYRNGRSQWQETGPGGVRFHYESPGYGGFSDFFKTFFGHMDPFTDTDLFWERRGAGQESAVSGVDTEALLEISLEEAFAGVEKEFLVNGRHLKVKVPPGMREGNKLRVARQGESMPNGGPSGDLYLSVRLRPHPFFQVKGKDLECVVPVTVTEAVLGGAVDIPTLQGAVTLKIPPHTQNGKVFRLRGMGLPETGGGNPGNLMVKLQVTLPETLTEQEEELYKNLAQLRKENPRAHLAGMFGRPAGRH